MKAMNKGNIDDRKNRKLMSYFHRAFFKVNHFFGLPMHLII